MEHLYHINTKALRKAMIDSDYAGIQELATDTEINRNSLSQILRGEGNPTYGVMTTIAAALNLTTAQAGEIFFAEK